MEKRLNRRDWAKSLVAIAATPALGASTVRELRLQNASLEFRVGMAAGKVTALHFTDRVNRSEIDLPPAHFELEFHNGRVLGPLAMELTRADRSSGGMDLFYFSAAPPIEVRARYTLPPQAAYLRKQISVRRPDGPGSWRLVRANLDDWRGVRRNWSSMTQDSLPHGSHPIFCDHLWAGVEFPAAFNRYDGGGFVLCSRPGGPQVTSEWVDLHSTVVGVAPRQFVREAFLQYIEDIRLAPARWVACYNSWWTLPLIVKQEEYLELMRSLKENLFDKHAVFFDFVATDAGWNDPRSIWQIDRKNLPHGFDDMRAIVEAAGAQPGLWMSPGEEYAPNFDYNWGKHNGYAVLANPHPEKLWAWQRGVSIADPKYREETKAQLRRLIRENQFGHIKYDGLVAREDAGHDGLLPGDDSVEPIAAYSLELMQVSKEANPRLVTEPTYLNSLANYISPWIIKYSDTVWGNAGGDCPLAFTPAPDYREAHTSAREYFIFRSLDEIWLPQNALQYFDIVHCDDEPGFANHAAMAVGRGRFFLSTYLNPKYMTVDHWRVYAGLLKWARRNQEILRNTKVLRSSVEIGEPYAYAHWLGRRGIVAVRNPSNETRSYTLDLRQAGAPASLSDGLCYTQYPYRSGIASGLDGASHIALSLAPWELLFLEIVPRAELKEPVVIGARWYRNAGQLLVAPVRGPGSAVLIQPDGGDRKLPVPGRAVEAVSGAMIRKEIRSLRQDAWLRADGKPVDSVAFEMECQVRVPRGAKGTALFLVEFPGRQHRPSRASLIVNGEEIPARQKTSANHVGYYMPTEKSPWSDVTEYEAEWTWYIVGLGEGRSTVRIAGAAGHPNARVGAWAWCERDVRSAAAQIDADASEPVMPQHEDHLEREGICLHNPRISRIR